tara:strand:- start:458 stop:682 length:225 start_codon:yes stop_codon:yes gene_type:complete
MKILIEVGDVEYSRLSKQLTFKVVCNTDAILATEDSMFQPTDLTMEEVAAEMGKKLQRVIYSDYSRGGMRIRYD